MAVLSNSKHERFAQLVAKGVSATDAYVSAGYSKANARSNASRLSANDSILGRIKELKTAVAEKVISAEIRRRNWRVQVLQNRVDAMLALTEARAAMYADQKEGSHEFQVNTLAEERAAIDEGCHALPPGSEPLPADGKEGSPPLPRPTYPKTMVHPGYPNGAATGLLVKDYRGKDANQEVWKFDSALEARLADDLKQAAIEEGQWTEKRQVEAAGAAERKARINRGRDRLAAEKAAALARGEVWR